MIRWVRKFQKLNNTGDTIVEVLIVLAVLGLALSISYATANRGLQQSRNAQEHSEALGIINSQIELLRSAFVKQSGSAVETQGSSGPFCLSPPAGSVIITPLANSGPDKFNENLATDKLGNTTTYPGPCIQNTLYSSSIVGRGNGVYDFRVRWEGLGKLGRQQEELTYKIGNVTLTPTSGYTDPEVPPPPAAPPLTLSFTASPTTVSEGGSLTLDWSTNPTATGCTASGDWSGSRPDHGSASISIPNGTAGTSRTYTLTCNAGAASVSQTVSVNITAARNLTTFYRLFSFISADHLYSTDRSGDVACCAYSLEGNVGLIDTIKGPGEIPLYRSYSSGLTDHFYTTNKAESDIAPRFGYSYEGIAGYIMPYSSQGCPTGTTPLYRMYSSYLTDHFYTIDFNEYAKATDMQWQNIIGGGFPWYNYSEGIIGCTFTNANSINGTDTIKDQGQN
jgi:type II secretory pathway pseudopilin PulG